MRPGTRQMRRRADGTIAHLHIRQCERSLTLTSGRRVLNLCRVVVARSCQVTSVAGARQTHLRQSNCIYYSCDCLSTAAAPRTPLRTYKFIRTPTNNCDYSARFAGHRRTPNTFPLCFQQRWVVLVQRLESIGSNRARSDLCYYLVGLVYFSAKNRLKIPKMKDFRV